MLSDESDFLSSIFASINPTSKGMGGKGKNGMGDAGGMGMMGDGKSRKGLQALLRGIH